MKIRQMTIDDYDSVVAVWQAAGIGLDAGDDSPSGFNRTLVMNPTSCLVAVEKRASFPARAKESQGNIVGAVLGMFNGRRAWVNHLAVLPQFQGRGIGKALILALEKEVVKLGAPKLQLAVDKGNSKALVFYHKLGFEPVTDSVWLSKILRKRK